MSTVVRPSRTNTKRLTSAVVAVFLAIGSGLVVSPARAAEGTAGGFVYSDRDIYGQSLGTDNIRIIGCDGTCPTEVTIPDTLDGKIVVQVAQGEDGGPGFSNVTSLYFDGNSHVTLLGDTGFTATLTDVSLPNSLTTIRGGTFRYSGITNLYIPASVTEAQGAFYQNRTLYSIEVDPDNPTYQSIDGVLYNKDGTYLIQYPSGNESTTFTVPNGVRHLGTYSVAFNTFLNTVIVSSTVFDVGDEQFQGDTSLTNVVFLNTGASQFGSSTFYDDPNIEWIYFRGDLPSGDAIMNGATVSKVYYDLGTTGWTDTFGANPSLSITGAPTTPSLTWETNGNDTQVITGFSVPGLNQDTVNYQDFALTIPSKIDNKDVVELAGNSFSNDGLFTAITLASSVRRIGDNSLANMWRLKTLDLGSGLVAIGDNAIQNNQSLKRLTLPDSLELVGSYSVNNLTGLKSLTINATSSLTTLGDGAISYLAKITTLRIPEHVEAIGYGALMSLDRVKSFIVADANANFKSVAGVLYSKDGARILVYPQGKKYIAKYDIPSGVTTIDEAAFAGAAIGTVTIPATVADINWCAFCASNSDASDISAIQVDPTSENYKSISDVLYSKDGSSLIQFPNQKSGTFVVPESVNYVWGGAFRNAEKVTSIALPSSVMYLEQSSFENDFALKTIVIPGGVVSIYDSAFNNDHNLTNIVFLGDTPPELGSGVFSRVPASAKVWNTVTNADWTEAFDTDYDRFKQGTTTKIAYAPTAAASSKARITGKAKVGKVLTAKTGKWTTNTLLPTTFSYMWYTCEVLNTTQAWGDTCGPINGATASTYKLTASEKGKFVYAVIVASGIGHATQISAPTGLVQ